MALNYQTLMILAEQMQMAPDELNSVNEAFAENESGLDQDVQDFIEAQTECIKTILNDDDLSIGIKLGYAISTAAVTIARSNNTLPSDVFGALYERAATQERATFAEMAIRRLLGLDQDNSE